MLDYEKQLKRLISSDKKKIKFNNICGDQRYQNIHPVKQLKVKQLVEELIELDINKEITKIIVFGSAISFQCSSYSDIDLLVIGTFDYFRLPIHTSKYGKVDLLAYNEIEFEELLPVTRVFQKALEEGVVLYE